MLFLHIYLVYAAFDCTWHTSICLIALPQLQIEILGNTKLILLFLEKLRSLIASGIGLMLIFSWDIESRANSFISISVFISKGFLNNIDWYDVIDFRLAPSLVIFPTTAFVFSLICPTKLLLFIWSPVGLALLSFTN